MILNAILIAAAALLVGLASGQRTQSVWGQCGGSQYTGPTNCAQGNYCSYGNDYYYQCVPGTAVPDEPLPQETGGTPDEPIEPEPTQAEPEPTEVVEDPGVEEPTPIQIIPTRSSIRGPFPTITRTIFNPSPTAPSRGGGGSASVIVVGGRTYSLVVPVPTARPGGEEEGEGEEGAEGEGEEGGEGEGEEYGGDGAPAGTRAGAGVGAGAVKKRFMPR